MTSIVVIVLLLSTCLCPCTNSEPRVNRLIAYIAPGLVQRSPPVELVSRPRRDVESIPPEVESTEDRTEEDLTAATDEVTSSSITTGSNTKESPPAEAVDEVISQGLLNDDSGPLKPQKRENAKIPNKKSKPAIRKGLVENNGEHMEVEGATGIRSNGSYKTKNRTSIKASKVCHINKTTHKKLEIT